MADEFGFGFSTGNPAGYVKAAINEGWSASEALTTYRADGGEVGNGTWYRLYGEVGAALDRAGVAAGLDPFQIPAGADYSVWSVNGPQQYATQVNVLTRDKTTGVVGARQFTYMTAVPHAPGEAELAAFDQFTDEDLTDVGGSLADLVALGTVVTNIYRTEPWEL